MSNIKKYSVYVLQADANKSGNNYQFFKIGELLNADRDDNLIKKYTKNTSRLHSDVKQLDSKLLPHTQDHRLNDKALHSWIKKHPECNLKHVNKDLIEGIFNETDGYNEWFEFIDKSKPFDVGKFISNLIDTLSLDITNFKAKFKPENDVEIKQDYKHEVTSTNIELLRRYIELNNSMHSKLFVGQFNKYYIVDKAIKNKVYIWNDDASIKKIYTNIPSIDKNIVFYDDESKGDIYNMNNIFDIIANPPYSMTGTFIKSMLKNVNFDNFVLIAPLSDLLPFYNYISSIQPADPKAFVDAKIVKNLSIVTITKNPCNIFASKDELSLTTYDKEYLEFYKLNLKCPELYKKGGGYAQPAIQSLIDSKKSFFIGPYMGEKGFTIGNNLDAEFNILGRKDKIQAQYEKNKSLDKPQNGSTLDFIDCPSENFKNNLTIFEYENPIANKLIIGLHKQNGSIKPAIPNINFNIKRDYIHLSLEDIMQILKEENPDVA